MKGNKVVVFFVESPRWILAKSESGQWSCRGFSHRGSFLCDKREEELAADIAAHKQMTSHQSGTTQMEPR